MISQSDGPLREDVQKLGIEVRIKNDFIIDWNNFLKSVWTYDLVVVNTLLPMQAVQLLNLAHMPVVWWIHEAETFFDMFEPLLFDFSELKPHVHVWAVSSVVQETIRRRRGYEAEVVPFCVPDAEGDAKIMARDIEDESGAGDAYARSGEAEGGTERSVRSDTVTFLTIGDYCIRKGQDILQKAIETLPEKTRQSCRFLFCGNQELYEPEVYEPLKSFAKREENVELIPYMPHEEMLKTIRKADYILVPSRQEPMSAVAAEGMMLSVPPVVSDICGIASYIDHERSGFLFESEKIEALCAAIEKAASLKTEKPEGYRAMCANARAQYEKEFSEERLREKLFEVMN
jgi:glycosyltransferase involved in cell wall biosynthesis